MINSLNVNFSKMSHERILFTNHTVDLFECSFLTTTSPVLIVEGCEGWSTATVRSRSTDTHHYQRLRGGQPQHDNINSMSCVGTRIRNLSVFSGYKSQTGVWRWLWFRDEVRQIFIFIIQIQTRTQYNYDLIRPNSFYKVLKFVTGGGL